MAASSRKMVGACETYREVCLRMGLIEDNSAWIFSLEETSNHSTPYQILATCAIIPQHVLEAVERTLEGSDVQCKAMGR
ncbi:unnamed protein product [Boreogadus saida]